MFCAVQKPYLLILGNLQSNKRQKTETLRFSNQLFAYVHLHASTCMSEKAFMTKIRYCPSIFLMVFRDVMIDYKGELKLVL